MILYFTSPIGLGHASRDIAIASLLEEDVIFVTGEPASRHLVSHGFKVINAYRKMDIVTDKGIFKHRLKWLINYASYYEECKDIARGLIDSYKPRLVISDEDFAAVSVSNTKTVLITDIFESRFLEWPTKPIEYIVNLTMKRLISKAYVVIAPMNGMDHANIFYTGPIVRIINKDREALRRELGFEGKVILTSIGGSSAGRFLLEAVIDAYDKVRDLARLVIVSGPSILLNKDLDGERIRYYSYVSNLHEFIYASDLFISLAGRSSIDEAMVYGTPAIFIPIKHHFEQEENAKRLGFRFEDVYRLDELILEYLNKPRVSKAVNGVYKAVRIIKDIL